MNHSEICLEGLRKTAKLRFRLAGIIESGKLLQFQVTSLNQQLQEIFEKRQTYYVTYVIKRNI
jgi:hypothetical protein